MAAARTRVVVRGEVRVPGDKSVSHRALMFSTLADAPSTIRGILQSADIESTAGALRALGRPVPQLSPVMRVDGSGLLSHLPSPISILNCGNSGTSARLLMGLVAGWPVAATLTGDASLSRRPMRRVATPLTAMGARVEFGGTDGLPLTVHGGALRSLEWTMSASAQVKSALLLAGVTGGVAVVLHEPVATRDHTERIPGPRGRDRRRRRADCPRPASRLALLGITVPATSAAAFAALGALADSGSLVIRDVLNPGAPASSRCCAAWEPGWRSWSGTTAPPSRWAT